MKKLILLLVSINVWAQNPPPPLATPLNPPADPVGNPTTVDKVMLGKILYWDEQLSSTKTVACASCHIMSSGGTDPRANINNTNAQNPGFDGVFQTADDVTGSPGVAQTDASGKYVHNDTFLYNVQVTGRKSPSVINVGYAASLFWDGRAIDQLIDPITNQVILSSGAALESQVLGPPVSSAEMAHTGRNWHDVIQSIEQASPMALSTLLYPDMQNWIGNQSYYQLFENVFGSTEITASKIAMSIASYERSLYSNQSPFDANLNGDFAALTQQERRGLGVFRGALCGGCHATALLSDNNFHNIGVTPNFEDEGRFAVTGINADKGRFKTPPLRNLESRSSFMHNGGFSTLEQVVEFYDRGGDFNNPNLDPRMVALNLTQVQKDDLVLFLKRPLTDLRVSNETGPFSSPMLYSESNRMPQIAGSGIAGTNAKTPRIIANQPPLLGNKSFTVSVDNSLSGSQSLFVMSLQDPGLKTIPQIEDSIIYESRTLFSDNGDGHVSISIELPANISMNGVSLYGRWYIEDNQAINGLAISPLLQITLFKPEYGHAGQIFSASFD